MKLEQYGLEKMIDGLKSEQYQGIGRVYRYSIFAKSLLVLFILAPVLLLQVNDTSHTADQFSLLLNDTEADFEIFEEDLLLLEESL